MGTPSAAATAGATTTGAAGRCSRVRVVGKIRAFPASGDGNTLSSDPCDAPRVCVLKSEAGTSSHATIVFGEGQGDGSSRRESYKLDWCYDQDEDVNVLFLKEIKPLIEGTFQGADATVIAFGAKGSGKTQLIEGSEEKPGIASLAIADILALCEETWCTIQVSYYEVRHDHVIDLIEKKDQGVQVLEDASGRIQLRGLSQVSITSVSEFSKLFLHESKQKKPSQKNTTDTVTRSHKGLIIYVSHRGDNDLVTCCKGRMNFVDLAGYEDSKQKSSNRPLLVETVRINKSLYALTNLLGSLNRNETRVPYRESKLTHLLKGSLIKETSQTLMITCLSQKACQETVQVVSMASQSCLVVNSTRLESVVKNNSKQRQSVACSPLSSRSLSLSTSFKKTGVSRLGLLDKKPSGFSPVTKGRQLFNVGGSITKSAQKQITCDAFGEKTQEQSVVVDKEEFSANIAWGARTPEQTCQAEKMKPFTDDTVIIPFAQDIEIPPMVSPSPSSLHQEEIKSLSIIPLAQDVESSQMVSPTTSSFHQEVMSTDDTCLNSEEEKSIIAEVGNIEQSRIASDKKVITPPLSERLREITNSLKALAYQPLDQVELKTPGPLVNIMVNEECRTCSTPQDILKSLKKSLVHQLINYINSASKDELQQLKGIGQKRAAYIINFREESPFTDMNDLKKVGLSTKQVKEIVKNVLGEYHEQGTSI